MTKYADGLVYVLLYSCTSGFQIILSATSSTITQLTDLVESVVSAISPSQDAGILTAKLRRAMANDIPKSILYYNYIVGECRDLIFGVSLVEYATAHNLPEGAVPKVVNLCVKEVEARGMDTEGIYRVRNSS